MLNVRAVHLLVAGLSILFSTGALAASEGQPLTLRNAIETTRFMVADRDATSIAFSPDGSRYGAMLIRGDVDRDGVEIEIVAGALDSIESARPYSVARLFTRGYGGTMHGAGNAARLLEPTTNFPVWIDDDHIAFRWEDADGVHQVIAADVRSRNWRFLTESETDVTSFAVGARGALIYEAKQPFSLERSKQLLRDGFVVTNTDAYSVLAGVLDGSTLKDIHWGLGEKYVRVGASPGQERKVSLTKGGISTYHLAWPMLRPTISPDGRKALVSGTPDAIPDAWKQYDENWLRGYIEHWENRRASNARGLEQHFVVSIDDASARPLWDAPMNQAAYPSTARWSPDSRSVLVWPVHLPVGATEPGGLTGNAVAVVDVSTGAYATLPVPPEDAQTISDARWEEANQIVLRFKEDRIAFRRDGGRWNRIGKVPDEPQVAGIRLELRQDANTPPALYAIDDRSGQEEMIFDPNPQLRTQFALGRVEFIRWRDDAGHPREGRLFLPVGYKEGRRYPLVIQTHAWGRREDFTLYGQGSPKATLGPAGSVYMAQPLAARGIAVLQVGATPASDQSPEAQARMRGFLSAIEHLDAEGLVDRERVGIMGHSRSGWHAGYTLAFSDFPFRAAIVDDNINSGYFEETMIGWARDERRNGEPPFGAGMKDWLEVAPPFSVEHVRTPLLMMVTDSYGEMAAPLAQWEMFTRLRHLKKPVELWVAPNIGRGAHNLQNPTQLLAQKQRAMDWWLYWLKDERDPSEAKREQYAGWDKLRELRDQDAKRPKPLRLRWTVEEVQATAH